MIIALTLLAAGSAPLARRYGISNLPIASYAAYFGHLITTA